MKVDYIISSPCFVSRLDYLKQLNIQKYYALKFSINFASSWLKPDIDRYIEALNQEIELYRSSIEKDKNYKQERLEIL